MTASILSSLGLSLSNISSFGFSGSLAANVFGQQTFNNFVQQEANLVNIPTGVDYDALLTFAQNVDTSQNAAGNSGAAQQLIDVNTLLMQNTGSGLDDISISYDGSGNITASLDGVAGATNTINIGDVLNQALDSIVI